MRESRLSPLTSQAVLKVLEGTLARLQRQHPVPANGCFQQVHRTALKTPATAASRLTALAFFPQFDRLESNDERCVTD